MGVDERIRLLPEGARVAIVGAGPAGCLMAIALLDAAQARRRPLQVTLLHGGAPRRRRILVDGAALARFASAGVPIPEGVLVPLHGARGIHGRAQADLPLPLFAAPRDTGGPDDLVDHLRATAMERGARLIHRAAETIHAAPDGGWTVRAGGASLRAEAVVLACGAGAPLAARLPGHQPPPVWRACAADLEAAPDAPSLAPWATRIHGEGGLPDLWILSAEGDEQALAVGEDAGPAALAEALLAAVGNGRLPPLRLRNPRRVFLPAGVARPALPALGDALGGAPGACDLARLVAQAQTLAAAFHDGGPEAMLDAARAEALRLEPRVRREMRRARRWKARPRALVERAVAREVGRPAAWQPVHQSLAASAAPGGAGSRAWLLALQTFFAFLLAWILVAWDGVWRRGAPRPLARSNEVFVVDDDAELAELVCEYLQGRGIACVPFRDGMSAVAAAARERPAAVVLDVALPWLDGPTICRALQRNGPVPVFLATALPLPLARPEGEAAGATAVLSKPLDLAGLALRIQAWVPARPPGAARTQRPQLPEAADAAQPPA